MLSDASLDVEFLVVLLKQDITGKFIFYGYIKIGTYTK